MNEISFFKFRVYFTSIVSIFIWALLAWSLYHGGVESHHLLAKKDLPAISNWWGGILVPSVTWFLLYRINKRIYQSNKIDSSKTNFPKQILYRFLGGLLFGISLSILFILGKSDMSGNLVLALIPTALFFPIYLSECLLGFILGMTFTFGGVLPTLIGSIFSLICSILYIFVRGGILKIISKLIRTS